MAAKSKLLRMDNVLIVVDDLEAAKAFFAELGMELEGETTVEGRWVDRVVGLNDVRADIAMMRTPDGHSRVELTKFHTPSALPACAATVPNSSARSRSTRTSTGSASCVALRASSSDWPSNSVINR
jgi:catechol 2,3-dioxygenase-like lactoylglutathione lyase family enzyme